MLTVSLTEALKMLDWDRKIPAPMHTNHTPYYMSMHCLLGYGVKVIKKIDREIVNFCEVDAEKVSEWLSEEVSRLSQSAHKFQHKDGPEIFSIRVEKLLKFCVVYVALKDILSDNRYEFSGRSRSYSGRRLARVRNKMRRLYSFFCKSPMQQYFGDNQSAHFHVDIFERDFPYHILENKPKI